MRHRTAAEYFLQAANKGDGTAALMLGRLHKGGKGVLQNDGEATKWYKISEDLKELHDINYMKEIAVYEKYFAKTEFV
jgi:TPR repeat protein